MLFATPLAILGAVYSAYFMSPRLRQVVKPSIEIMEAVPTVILGFLAGLWFAPFVESHLPAVFSILFLMPLALIIAGFVRSEERRVGKECSSRVGPWARKKTMIVAWYMM